MDYDRTAIPAGYDRGRNLTPDTLEIWMDTVARFVPDKGVERIVDLGCGTGRFSNSLALRFGATVIAIDPSHKMLAQAKRKDMRGTVHLVRGSGEAIPLSDRGADVIFISMAYHHFTDTYRAALECRRVAPLVFVRTGTRDRIEEYPYVEFMPASRPLLSERLPSAQEIVETFARAGFDPHATDVIVQQIAPTYGEYADRLAAGGDSVLASLEQRDFDNGLAAIRGYARAVDPVPVTEPIDVLVFRRDESFTGTDSQT